MRRGAVVAAVIIIGAVAFAASSRAQNLMPASFNCDKARGWVEKTIFGDPELADKDSRMAIAYEDLVAQAREGGGENFDIRMFRDEQRAWLRERNSCRTRACL